MVPFFSVPSAGRSTQSSLVGVGRAKAHWLRLFFAGLIFASLAACSTIASVAKAVIPTGNRLDWSGVTVIAAPDANLNTPVALDIVQVRDEATLALVSGLPAAKWFASRADLIKTFPEGLGIKSLEVTPGMTVKLGAGDFAPSRQVGVFIFADYLTAGEHRARADQLKGDILVRLGSRSFSVTALKAQ
jgi:type VI secretion system protein